MTNANDPGKELTAATATEENRFARIVFHSICSAACAIVPVPFLDEHLIKLTRRRMAREFAAARELELSAADVAALSGTESKPLGWGCFGALALGLAFKVAVKILRRFFRTILFWLLVKDAADAASRTFHEGYLIDRALDRPVPGPGAAQPAASPEPSAMARLRVPVERVLANVNTKGLTHAFRGVLGGSRTLLVSVARTLSRLTGLRAEADDGEQTLERQLADSIPASLVERVARQVLQQGDYLRHLDELLADQFYQAQPVAATPADSASGSDQEPRPTPEAIE